MFSFQLAKVPRPIMTKPILAALAASFLAAACAADLSNSSTEPRAEREYRTGSNIATRKADGPSDGPSVVSGEELERARSNSLPPSTIPKAK